MSQQTESLCEQIEREAREVGHDPGPWVPQRGGLYVACVQCGEEAFVKDGECQYDHMQDACGEVQR